MNWEVVHDEGLDLLILSFSKSMNDFYKNTVLLRRRRVGWGEERKEEIDKEETRQEVCIIKAENCRGGRVKFALIHHENRPSSPRKMYNLRLQNAALLLVRVVWHHLWHYPIWNRSLCLYGERSKLWLSMYVSAWLIAYLPHMHTLLTTLICFHVITEYNNPSHSHHISSPANRVSYPLLCEWHDM